MLIADAKIRGGVNETFRRPVEISLDCTELEIPWHQMENNQVWIDSVLGSNSVGIVDSVALSIRPYRYL